MKPTTISLLKASELLGASYPALCRKADYGGDGFPRRVRGAVGPPSRMIRVADLRAWCKKHRPAAVSKIDAWVKAFELAADGMKP